MGQPAEEQLLCPRCKVPMIEAVGVPGVWQCPKRASHEFMEDPPRKPKASPKKAPEPAPIPDPKPDPPPPKCPKCGTRAKKDDLGLYCDSPVHQGVYRLPKGDEPHHWLAHIGITTPLHGVRQSSNELDGALLQGIGDIKKGGGGGSGRKRKKPKKFTMGNPDFYGV